MADDRWLPIEDVAEIVGVEARSVRKWVSHPTHPLPARKQGRRRVVQVSAAIGWATNHARLPGFIPPKSKPVNEPLGETPPAVVFTGSAHEILKQAAQAMQVNGGQLSPQQMQALSAAARELRQKEDSDAKAASRFDAEQVTEMLLNVGKTWCEETEKILPIATRDLIATIREQFAVDLIKLNVASASIVEARLRDSLVMVIEAVKKSAQVEVAQ